MSAEPSRLPARSLEDALPPEVSDMIFDSLSDLDNQEKTLKQSLFACSLVCKSWCRHTFRHRFRSLSLYVGFRRDVDDLDGEVDLPEHMSFFVEKFMKLELFVLAKDVVRSLTLCYGKFISPINIGLSFVCFVKPFPRLQSLELVGAFCWRVSDVATPSIAPIKQMTIRKASESLNFFPLKLSALYEIIGAFTEIEELRLVGDIDIEEDGEDPGSDALSFPRITSSLAFNVPFGLRQFIPLAQELVMTQPLQKLDVFGYQENFDEILELVQALPASPEHLLFSLPVNRSTDLHGLPDLKRITIAVELLPTPHNALKRHAVVDDRNIQVWKRVTEALMSLDQVCHLEYIELVLMPEAPHHDPTSLTALDALERAAGATKPCEDVLIRIVQEKRLDQVRVSLCRIRPHLFALDKGFSWSSDESIRKIFPRLDELGALDS